MRSNVAKILILCAAAVAVSSCDSRVETLRTTPPAADLKYQAEPPYPEAALGAGPAAAQAEALWWNDVLAWGRSGWGNVARICQWSIDMGKELPEGWCDG